MMSTGACRLHKKSMLGIEKHAGHEGVGKTSTGYEDRTADGTEPGPV